MNNTSFPLHANQAGGHAIPIRYGKGLYLDKKISVLWDHRQPHMSYNKISKTTPSQSRRCLMGATAVMLGPFNTKPEVSGAPTSSLNWQSRPPSISVDAGYQPRKQRWDTRTPPCWQTAQPSSLAAPTQPGSTSSSPARPLSLSQPLI